MSILPPLYEGWITELLGEPLQGEKHATCDNCAMCHQTPEDSPETAYFFNNNTKCCTYLPDLPNFLVGRILDDSDPALDFGRAALKHRLQNGPATPLGAGITREFSNFMKNEPEGFGRSATYRCPHFIEEGGLCGIWRHRNSVCSTWFCKHERGLVGRRFWISLHQFLNTLETNLSQWCMLQFDFEPESLKRVFPLAYDQVKRDAMEKEGLLPPETTEDYKILWGSWYGREHEYYRECARLVDGLQWEDLRRICGPELDAYRRILIDAHKNRQNTELPAALKYNGLKSQQDSVLYTMAVSYSPFDPLRIPARLMEILPMFDGRPVETVVDEIQAQKGLKLSQGLLRKLVDFEILLSA